MKRFLMNLVTAVRQLGRPSRQEERLQLSVEALEERLALSTSPLGTHAPVLPHARVGHAGHVAHPLRPVYGYKHRRRWPYHKGWGPNWPSPPASPPAVNPGIARVVNTAPALVGIHFRISDHDKRFVGYFTVTQEDAQGRFTGDFSDTRNTHFRVIGQISAGADGTLTFASDLSSKVSIQFVGLLNTASTLYSFDGTLSGTSYGSALCVTGVEEPTVV